MAAAYMQQIGVGINQIRPGVSTERTQRRPPPQQSFKEFKV
jgi:hypothetical protein